MNRTIGNVYLWGLCLILLLITACSGDRSLERYNELVEMELASGQRNDSLFFGIHFGMGSKDFYGHCWKMNKKGLFTDGENNTAVLYKLNKGELPHSASMNFYPSFYKDKIHQMGVFYEYNGWAPWNKHLFADSLQLEVLKMYKDWYRNGNPFIEMKDDKRGTIFVKVDGNRRIIIGKFDDSHVKVDYTDLLVETEIKGTDEKK